MTPLHLSAIAALMLLAMLAAMAKPEYRTVAFHATRSRRFWAVSSLMPPFLLFAWSAFHPELLAMLARFLEDKARGVESGPCLALKALAVFWLAYNFIWHVIWHLNPEMDRGKRHRWFLLAAEFLGGATVAMVLITLYLTVELPHTGAAEKFLAYSSLLLALVLTAWLWAVNDAKVPRSIKRAVLLEICALLVSAVVSAVSRHPPFADHEAFAVALLLGAVVSSSVRLFVGALMDPVGGEEEVADAVGDEFQQSQAG